MLLCVGLFYVPDALHTAGVVCLTVNIYLFIIHESFFQIIVTVLETVY